MQWAHHGADRPGETNGLLLDEDRGLQRLEGDMTTVMTTVVVGVAQITPMEER